MVYTNSKVKKLQRNISQWSLKKETSQFLGALVFGVNLASPCLAIVPCFLAFLFCNKEFKLEQKNTL